MWAAKHTPISAEQTTIPEGFDMDRSEITLYTASEGLVFMSVLPFGPKYRKKGDNHASSADSG
jgi:hypothetical protein